VNRSILIVICDFIVSAMLSFYTSTPPVTLPGAGSGGVMDSSTAAIILSELNIRQLQLEDAKAKLREAQNKEGFSEAREAALKTISDQLAETMAKKEILERKLSLTKNTAGPQSPAELQDQIDKEIKARAALKIKLDESGAELTELKKIHQTTAGDLTTLRENYAVVRQQLADSKESLNQKEQKLETAGAELLKTKENLAAREADLTSTKTALSEYVLKTDKLQSKTQEYETDLSFTRGKLNNTERDLAEFKSLYEKNRNLAAAREAELSDAKRKLEDMQGMLKNAVTELSKTKTELNTTKQAAENINRELIESQGKVENTEAKLATTQEKLTDAEAKLRSDVLNKYNAATVKLNIKVKEKRMLIDIDGGGEYYLPVIAVNGKNYLISSFDTLVGAKGDKPLTFDRVSDIDYQINGSRLNTPVIISKFDPRIAILEIPAEIKTAPIAILDSSGLKSRGLDNLYLFKTSSYGKESSSLNGRCSVDFASKDPYMYIRNGSRASNQLAAEPGDFVLNKQGEFIGVVVAKRSDALGRNEEAKCFIFPDNFTLQGAGALSTSNLQTEAFAAGVKKNLETIQNLNQ